MQSEWQSYWAAGRTGFHQSEVHPVLERYYHQLNPTNDARVLVPLCGKTLDLPWLERRATSVVGSEWVAQAIREFFDEQQRSATVSEHEHHRQHESGTLSLFEGDFLELTGRDVGRFDFCWDRASMIALPPQTRERYVPHLVSLMNPGGRILLVTFVTDKPADSGPPYPVQPEEIHQFYSPFGNVELLETIHTTAETSQRLRDRGLEWVREDVFCITCNE